MSGIKHLSVATPSRFSSGWCIGVALLHFAATFIIAVISFGVEMCAFTASNDEAQRVRSAMTFWAGVRWIWTPLAMAAWNPNAHDIFQLVVLAFLWSCCVGVFAGFAVISFRRWLDTPLYPPSKSRDKTRDV